MIFYTEKQLVSIAKRENNNKRGYLVVNPLQGKHVPTSPKKSLELFQALGQTMDGCYENETILYVGFAETATAIGATVAQSGYFIQTTREHLDGVEYLYFSEAHSHATEQKLCKTDLDGVMDKIHRIIFVEDEVTTGNTIQNIVNIIQKTYGNSVHFAVASLLNGMDDQALNRFAQQNIPLHYLVKTDHSGYESVAQALETDGQIHPVNTAPNTINSTAYPLPFLDGRRLCASGDYHRACQNLWDSLSNLPLNLQGNILVLGTEETMYPGLFLGANLEKQGHTVHFHATTRSPIAVGQDPTYPLHHRHNLVSLYDENRTTFLYNLAKYDLVILVTDGKCPLGLTSLQNALTAQGNTEMVQVIL